LDSATWLAFELFTKKVGENWVYGACSHAQSQGFAAEDSRHYT